MEEYEAQARQAVRCRLTPGIRPISLNRTKETTMTLRRRTLLQAGAAASAAASLAGFAPAAFAQATTKLRVGYLHTPAVDGQIFLGQQLGTWAKHGLELELRKFTTGLELFQAMIGGSLDVLSTGAVVSNFPARGQGKVFLINDIEYATAQLWVRDDSIKSLADLKGKQISTTTGTTAHVFLDRALRSGQPRPGQGRADRQPAHGRGGDVVHLRRRAGGGALGAVRPDREAEGAERAQDRRRLGVLPAGRDHGRLGRAQRLLRHQQAGARAS